MEKTALRERFWIWGHDAGCHHAPGCARYRIPGVNRMGPWEGARRLGIPNCCRVVFGGSPRPPFDEAAEELEPFHKVVWSVVGDGSSTRNDSGGDDLEEVLRQARLHGNVVGAVLDDFFRLERRDARLSLERLREIRRRLHGASPRPLSLWLVYYAALLEADFGAWLDSVDVVTFWSWNSSQLARAEENLQRLIGLTPGKKHYAGCYIYNYGDSRPIAPAEMTFQLELYHRLLKEHRIDGVVVCSNTVVDVGLEAPEILRAFLLEHGDDPI